LYVRRTCPAVQSSTSGSTRELELWGSGADGSFALGEEAAPAAAAAAAVAQGGTLAPGSFFLRGAIAPSIKASAKAPASALTSPPPREDERDADLSLELHGLPPVRAIAEAVRRILETADACWRGQRSVASVATAAAAAESDFNGAGPGGAWGGDVAARLSAAHAAALAAGRAMLPALDSRGPFDLSKFTLIDEGEGGGGDSSAGGEESGAGKGARTRAPCPVRIFLPFHVGRCAASYPGIWAILSKVRAPKPNSCALFLGGAVLLVSSGGSGPLA